MSFWMLFLLFIAGPPSPVSPDIICHLEMRHGETVATRCWAYCGGEWRPAGSCR